MVLYKNVDTHVHWKTCVSIWRETLFSILVKVKCSQLHVYLAFDSEWFWHFIAKTVNVLEKSKGSVDSHSICTRNSLTIFIKCFQCLIFNDMKFCWILNEVLDKLVKWVHYEGAFSRRRVARSFQWNGWGDFQMDSGRRNTREFSTVVLRPLPGKWFPPFLHAKIIDTISVYVEAIKFELTRFFCVKANQNFL